MLRATPAADDDLLATTAVLVLAGGRGTRLQELTTHTAKPAMPFGGSWRLIDFTLSNCVHSGLGRIDVLVQHGAASLLRHLRQAWQSRDWGPGEGVEAIVGRTDDGGAGFRGTADAVRQSLDLVCSSLPRRVLVLAGDHVCRMDYRPLLEQHERLGADVTVAGIALPPTDCHGLGVMHLDADGRVRGFTEKPADPVRLAAGAASLTASMGIYVFDVDVLVRWLGAAPLAGSHDFGHDLLPHLVEYTRVFAHDFADSCVEGGQHPYWRDVGTLDAYWAAHMDLLGPQPRLHLDDAAWPILGACGACPPAVAIANPSPDDDVALDGWFGAGSVVERARVVRSVLGPRTRVGRGSRVESSVLLPGAVVGRGCDLRRVIVDQACVVPDGLRLGVAGAAGGPGFRVTAGGVTLITADMLHGAPRAAA